MQAKSQHPPYSAHLTPIDRKLFPELKEHLVGERFSPDNGVIFSKEFYKFINFNRVEQTDHPPYNINVSFKKYICY